jgi:hypothetical protein
MGSWPLTAIWCSAGFPTVPFRPTSAALRARGTPTGNALPFTSAAWNPQSAQRRQTVNLDCFVVDCFLVVICVYQLRPKQVPAKDVDDPRDEDTRYRR